MQATRAVVILLFLVSAGLVLVVTVGGWNQLEGAIPVDIAYVLVYVTLAYYAWRWNRGVLPVGAALAVLLGVFAAVAAPGWFKRDGFGYEEPAISATLLGCSRCSSFPCRSRWWCSRCAVSSRAGTSSSSGASPPRWAVPNAPAHPA